MIQSKVVVALLATLLVGTTNGHRGGPFRGNRDNVFTSTLTCTPPDDVTVACSSRRVAEGYLACRTIPGRWGQEDTPRTVCADPAAALDTDECGCCGGACPAECTCECNGGLGWWIEKTGSGMCGGGHDGKWGDDVDTEEDAPQVLVCAPKLHATTAVASGQATCFNTCSLPN